METNAQEAKMYRVQLHRSYGADEDFDFDTSDQAIRYANSEAQEADTRKAEVWELDSDGCETRLVHITGRSL